MNRRAVACSTVVAVLVSTACSGGDDAASTTGDPTATSEVPAETQPAVDGAAETEESPPADATDENVEAEMGAADGTAAPTTTVPPDPWDLTVEVLTGTEHAALVARSGDIDNLGYGWPAGFDPFAGGATPVHEWTFVPEDDDPDGTDRIMVVSGFDFADLDAETVAFDGFTTETDRASSQPTPIVIEWDPVAFERAAIQLFVDDLQAPFFGDDLVVSLDGRPTRDMSAFVSRVDQSGPIGRLVTIGVLPEFHDLLADGRLEILIDGPSHVGGEGFAVDFAQVVLDPVSWEYSGSVAGTVIDAVTGAPLAGVLVSATNVVQAITDAEGSFVLDAVPAGRVVIGAGSSGYVAAAKQLDLEDGASITDAVIALEPVVEDTGQIVEALEADGAVDLYGVLFESGDAVLSDESTFVLAEVLGAIYANPDRRITIIGHTDNVGTPEYNADLSARRAQAVVDWLIGAGLPEGVATAEGRGETEPIADNATDEGRALNRRVELRVVLDES